MRARTGRAQTALTLAVVIAALCGAADADARTPMLMNMMKRINEMSNAGNLRGTVAMLNVVKAMAPPEMNGWPALAEKAKAAAYRGDPAGLKAACTACHDQYRDTYRNKYGSKAPDGKGPVPID